MPATARVGDPTNHPGTVTGPGLATVLVGGQPVAVVGDTHACAFPTGHPPSMMVSGSLSVLVGGRPVVRALDPAGCGAQVTAGFPGVQVG